MIPRTLRMCQQGSPIRFAEEHVRENEVPVMRSLDDFFQRSPGSLVTFSVLVAFERSN